MSTTARPRSSTSCCGNPARSASTSRSPSARWTATTWSASAASPSSPKCTAWCGTTRRINIVDTPGHADFGGEVERILNMVDGAIVLVDAAEGVLPQTKFVVGKALAARHSSRSSWSTRSTARTPARTKSTTEVFDLFAALGATDEPARFPDAVRLGPPGLGRSRTLDGPRKNLAPLFDLVVQPCAAADGRSRTRRSPWSRRILEYDNFLGRVLTGRLEQGRARMNMPVKVLRPDGARGGNRPADQAAVASAGWIACRSRRPRPATSSPSPGCPRPPSRTPSARRSSTAPLPAIPVDPPTLAMTFRINDGPLAGREGKKVTSRQIRDRLFREAEGNVAIKVTEIQRNRGVRGRRPRRTAARRADRADAPRGLRTDHRPPARADPEQPGDRRPRGADGGGAGRCRRALFRRGGREAQPPQGRAARHAPLRRRQGAADVHDPEPRPDRLPRRVPDRHPRHRHHEPAVRRLRRRGRARSRAAATAR